MLIILILSPFQGISWGSCYPLVPFKVLDACFMHGHGSSCSRLSAPRKGVLSAPHKGVLPRALYTTVSHTTNTTHSVYLVVLLRTASGLCPLSLDWPTSGQRSSLLYIEDTVSDTKTTARLLC